jgi:hypothetical protein
VSEQQTPQPRHSRTGRPVVVAGIVLAALALTVALFVIVRSLGQVVPEPVPTSLKPPPPDTGLVLFRANIRRKVMNLSARCRSKRRQFGDRITPAQDSLARGCDSAIAAVLAAVAALDTVRRDARKAASDGVLAEYNSAKLRVRAFTRSGLGSDSIDEDSLDMEIKKLISE